MNFKNVFDDRHLKYSKTKKGLIKNIYNSQKQNSTTRGHALPSYTKKWLSNWLLNNPEFHRLYDMWVISGYDKNLRPSVDRKDSKIGYIEYNIQLMDWKENHLKGQKENSINNSKVVIQLDLNNMYIAEFKSAKIAAETLGLKRSSISLVCNGKRNKTGGFRWKFKEQ